VAIVTGGSDGLGRAAAEKLAAEGARVAICARRKEHLEQAADEIRKATGGQVLAHVADVSRAADCERLVDAVVAQWGGVDILLNNAGTSAAAGFAAPSSPAGALRRRRRRLLDEHLMGETDAVADGDLFEPQ